MAGRPKGQGRGKPVSIETTAAGSRTMAGVGEATAMLAGPDNIRAWRELLRDPQVAGVWQQRQLALLATEWEVEAGGDGAPEERAAAFLRTTGPGRLRPGVPENASWTILRIFGGRVHVGEGRRPDRSRRYPGAGAGAFPVQGRRVAVHGRRRPGGDAASRQQDVGLPDAGRQRRRSPWSGARLASLLAGVSEKKRRRFWAVALEKFGMPTAKGVYPPGTSETEARRLLESLLAVHGRAAVAFPEGFQVELLQSMKTVGDDYRAFQDYWDRAVSKILLSQTMTTDDGSSKSQALVHEEVRDAVVQADADLLCESFNKGPAVWLTEWNFPGAVPPRVWRHIRRREDLSGRAVRDRHLAEASGLRPTKSYIEDVYGGEWEPAAKGLPRRPRPRRTSRRRATTT